MGKEKEGESKMIIVSGATGFIGRYLVTKLAKEGRKVLATGRNKNVGVHYRKIGIPFISLDVTKKEDFDKLPTNNIEAFVYLAALIPRAAKEQRLTPEDYLMVNSLGTYNALEYCKNKGVKKFIYTTSLFEVQNTWLDSNAPITEDTPIGFKYAGDHALYIISKIVGGEYVKHFTQEYGIQGIIYRLTGVHGLGSYPGPWEMFIEKATKSKPIEIWGDNRLRRDNMYIKDVVSALIAGIDSKNAVGLYNIGSGIGLTLEDEVKAIVKVFSPPNNPSKLIYCPEKPGLKAGHIFDISKAKRELSWTPKFSGEKMLIDYKNELTKHETGGEPND